MGDFQGLGVLDQDAVARGHAGAGHDRGRGGQAEGAGAGDHQHRHGVNQGLLQADPGDQPGAEGDQRDEDHHRDEDLADLVHQLLDRRLGGLGVFHQADDLRQHRFPAERSGAQEQAAFAVDRAAGDLVAGSLGHRQALAGDQRLVGVAAAVEHLAVHREAFAGTHHHLVAEAQLGDRHLFLATVAQAHRALRAQRLEGADGAGGLALGAAFQVLAEEDQGDHHGGGFEVEVRHMAGRGGQPEVDAEAVAGAGAEGDQQVHVAGTGLHRAPGGDIEARADDELHRGRQEELRPRRQHPVQAGPFHQHRQHQRQRQQQRGDHPPAFAAQAALGIVLAWLPRVEQAGLVAGLFHRL